MGNYKRHKALTPISLDMDDDKEKRTNVFTLESERQKEYQKWQEQPPPQNPEPKFLNYENWSCDHSLAMTLMTHQRRKEFRQQCTDRTTAHLSPPNPRYWLNMEFQEWKNRWKRIEAFELPFCPLYENNSKCDCKKHTFLEYLKNQ